MEHTLIPHLNESVSRVGLGTWAIGGWMWGGTDEKQAIATILQALDLGINLIDTAPVYGFGRSEEIVGKAIKQYGKREKVLIATKAGLSWKNPQEIYRDSRKNILKKEIEISLKRLKVDTIDLYQIHWPDLSTPFEETAKAIAELLKAGKIRAIGVSNFSVEQMQEFRKYAPLHSLQSPFNLFEKEIEDEEIPYCQKQKIAILGYGSLCRGLLSGKIGKNRQFTGDDLRKVDPKFQEPRFSHYLHATKRLEAWAKEKHKKSLLALAIRWSLDSGISVALWGARRPEQLKGLDEIWGWKLKAADLKEIDDILKETIPSDMSIGFMAPSNRKTA